MSVLLVFFLGTLSTLAIVAAFRTNLFADFIGQSSARMRASIKELIEEPENRLSILTDLFHSLLRGTLHVDTRFLYLSRGYCAHAQTTNRSYD